MREKVERLDLYNRDGGELWLELRGENWVLKSSRPDYHLKYLRICYEDSGEVYSVDPPGGPFIYIGGKIGDYVVGRIILGPEIILELKDYEYE